jgi:hypothetical protein
MINVVSKLSSLLSSPKKVTSVCKLFLVSPYHGQKFLFSSYAIKEIHVLLPCYVKDSGLPAMPSERFMFSSRALQEIPVLWPRQVVSGHAIGEIHVFLPCHMRDSYSPAKPSERYMFSLYSWSIAMPSESFMF